MSELKGLAALPNESQQWPRPDPSGMEIPVDQDDFPRERILEYTRDKSWSEPENTIYFFCDIHADADAFLLSLAASGGIIVTGPKDHDFHLTPEGEQATFIIAGDCFDKGPSTLRLLDLLQCLKSKGARLRLLAGNHDVRTYLGIRYAESKDPKLDHLFARMGEKSVPMLAEIYAKYIAADEVPARSNQEIRELLFPDDAWFQQFAVEARDWVKPQKLVKEISRIKEKLRQFETCISSLGLELRHVYAAVIKFRELFFEPQGPYYWFFQDMTLAHRDGSYLFVHAGLDDSLAEKVASQGVAPINSLFKQTLRDNPFELYNGPVGNAFRTKYRDSDYDFTALGAKALHGAGIYAIVHGHRNIHHGQRMLVREGMLNFECDATIDRNTRKLEGLSGPGAAVVVFSPDGTVKGLSTDYPYIKTFHPG